MIGTALRCGLALLVLIALMYAGSGRAADQITNGTIDRLTGQVVKDGGLDRAYYRLAGESVNPVNVKSWAYAEAITLETPEGVTIEAERVYKIPDNAQAGPTMPKTAKVKDKIKVPKAAVATAGRKLARLFPYAAAALTAYEVACALDLICFDEEEEQWLKKEREEQPYYTAPITVTGTGTTSPASNGAGCVAGFQGQRFNSLSSLRTAMEGCAVPGQPTGYQGQNSRLYSPAGMFTTGSGGMVISGTGGTTVMKLGCSGTNPTCSSTTPNAAYGGVGVRYAPATPMCPEGWGLNQGVCERYTERPATDQELEDAVLAREPSTLPPIIQLSAQKNQPLSIPDTTPAEFTPTTPTVQGAPRTTTTTTQNADGSTTTTTTTQKNTQTSSNSGGQTVTTNTIRIENKTITEKETITIRENSPPIIIREDSEELAPDIDNDPDLPPDQDPDPDEQEQPDPCADGGCEFQDSDMPEIPELYQRKYPNGIVGVFQAKWPQLQATPFVQGLTGMIPSIGGGGSCPAWSMNFDIMPSASYGTQSIPFECTILQIVGLIILTSACFAAWRIIF